MIDAAELRTDLDEALRKSTKGDGCPLCDFIRSIDDAGTRDALSAASAGTIGRDSLVRVLRKHGTGIGGKTVERHRNEEHTP